MNTVTTFDEERTIEVENPGVELASIRQQKGYTVEYVANKLHLRVRIIELIEQGAFDLLPEPVFVRGYLRAYAKLLGVSPDPFLAVFNSLCTDDKPVERALWQSKRESYKAEHFIRWFTIVFAIGVLVVISLWWQNNRDNQSVYSPEPKMEANNEVSLEHGTNKEIKLTDVSKMQALITPSPQMSRMEKKVD